jgi:RHS repeat-associated protein
VDDGATDVAQYEYDGLGRRIEKRLGDDDTPTATYDYYYSTAWQVLEVHEDGDAANPLDQFVWHPYYIDAPLVRYWDEDTNGTGIPEHYYLHDANFNVTAITDDAAAASVLERYDYTPYGELTVLDANFADDADGLSDVANAYTYTGREYDAETGLYNFRARYYHAQLGRFVNRDPIGYWDGFNLYANYWAVNGVDPSGLKDGWEWNWHHMLDQAIFTEQFLNEHGLDIKINSPEYGWMLRAKDHTWTGGIHPEGWSNRWLERLQAMKDEGVTFTKELIDEQLEEMIGEFKLRDLGFAAEYSYEHADLAYKAAERLARDRAIAQKAAAIAAKAARKAAGKPGAKSGIRSMLCKVPIIGTIIGTVVGSAVGEDEPLISTLEPPGFGAAMMGSSDVIAQADRDRWTFEAWLEYEAELNRRESERQRIAGGIDAIARNGVCPTQCYSTSGHGAVSREEMMAGRR